MKINYSHRKKDINEPQNVLYLETRSKSRGRYLINFEEMSTDADTHDDVLK